ncbi:unconventional myosin-Vc-like [Gymnodraco acuticeps]|uniref:Unconventional myosin-Vc-like n=1 Tax=Gymnodraco acuticeps TaxID=8218 RepID=A0A6P8UNS6_GYMAC|nr:unconventional myosin-Vc-like [Gymnodraco acuticeps]
MCLALNTPQIVKLLYGYTPVHDFEERASPSFILRVEVIHSCSINTKLFSGHMLHAYLPTLQNFGGDSRFHSPHPVSMVARLFSSVRN